MLDFVICASQQGERVNKGYDYNRAAETARIKKIPEEKRLKISPQV